MLKNRLAAHLKQGAVGFPTTLASSVGLIMASPVILTVTSGFGRGGDTFAVAILIGFIMMQAQLMSFSEAAILIPTTGSVYDYISCGMGRFFAITGALCAYLVVHVFAGTAETILSGVIAMVNFGDGTLHPGAHPDSWLVGVGMVLLFGLLNATGIEIFGKVEVVLTFIMWSTLLIFSLCGLLAAPVPAHAGWFGLPPDFHHPQRLISMTGMAMFMFVGCELVTPMAPEIRRADKTIPRAMALGLCGVAGCMLLFGAALNRQVPNVLLDAAKGVHLFDTPLVIPAFAGRVMGETGKLWLGAGMLLAGAATINTLMAAVPRILYGMALDGALPKCFTWLHPRFKTPVVAIAVAVVIPCIHAVLLRGDLGHILPMVLAAVCAWGVSYLLVTLSVVLLRLRRPDLPRAYRSPFFPLPQVLSSAGILMAIVNITPPGMNPHAILVPFCTMLALTSCYALFWSLFVMRINPFKPEAVEVVLERAFSDRALSSGRRDVLRSLE